MYDVPFDDGANIFLKKDMSTGEGEPSAEPLESKATGEPDLEQSVPASPAVTPGQNVAAIFQEDAPLPLELVVDTPGAAEEAKSPTFQSFDDVTAMFVGDKGAQSVHGRSGSWVNLEGLFTSPDEEVDDPQQPQLQVELAMVREWKEKRREDIEALKNWKPGNRRKNLLKTSGLRSEGEAEPGTRKRHSRTMTLGGINIPSEQDHDRTKSVESFFYNPVYNTLLKRGDLPLYE